MNSDKILASLRSIGVELPLPPPAKGNYLPYSLSGNSVYISGSLPIEAGTVKYAGKVGAEQSVESGYQAARLCAINALSHLRVATADFSQLQGITHVAGFVNGVDGFAESPKVVNGASDFLVEVFSEAGKHSRIAVSVNGLPLNASVEIQLIAALKND